MFIYKYTNPKNNKSYIGKWTNSINNLYTRYKKEINSPICNRTIINVLRKHGIDNIRFDIIKECNDSNELKILEMHFIKKYNSFKDGYNQTIGGDNGPGSKKGWKMSLEGRMKISLAKAGKPSSRKGKTMTLEQRERISKSKLGKKLNLSDDERKKRIERIVAYNKSEAGRLKSSEYNKLGGVFNNHYGKKHSEETKKRIGESRKNTYMLSVSKCSE